MGYPMRCKLAANSHTVQWWTASNREARSWTIVLHVGSFCTEVVLNGVLAFPECFSPSCHCARWQCCIAACFTQSLKTFLCTTTSCHFKHGLSVLAISLWKSMFYIQQLIDKNTIITNCTNSSNSSCSLSQSWQLLNSQSCDSSVASTFHPTSVYQFSRVYYLCPIFLYDSKFDKGIMYIDW